jgi:hypothetical protein
MVDKLRALESHRGKRTGLTSNSKLAGLVGQGDPCSDVVRLLNEGGQTTYDKGHSINNESECISRLIWPWNW